MPLFRLKAHGVLRIPPDETRIREDKIHQLIATNLSTLFDDLVLVARKPRIGGKEFDTLALNTATNTPVIIEYKRGKDRGVVEQVDMYYIKLKLNKAEVIMLFQKLEEVEDLGEIDFDNPQIIIVAREFTPEQRELLAMKRQYLSMFRYQFYRDGVLSLEEVEPLGQISSMSATSASGKHPPSPYSVDHFGMRAVIRKIYDQLDKGITSLDSLVKPGKVNKYFIGFAATGSYFCSVEPRVNSIKVEVKCRRSPSRPKLLKVRPIPDSQHTPMTHTFSLTSERQLKSALKVIKGALGDSM
jgi:hypothetical protein